MKIIHTFSGEYRFLSNFWDVPIQYKDFVYPRIENAYQAAKSPKHSVRRQFLTLSAFDAKEHGRAIALRPDWKFVRDKIMRKLIARKYRDSHLRELLLATGDAVLIEGNYWHDNYWGACTCQACFPLEKENKLGFMTMDHRTLLQRSAS